MHRVQFWNHACLAGKRLPAGGGCRAFSSDGSSVIDFGKHRGLTFEECHRAHPDYGKWLLNQPENARTNAFREFINASASSASSSSVSRDPDPPQRGSGGSGWETRDAPARDASARGPAQNAEVMSFGKHRGKTFAEVCQTDAQYAQWVSKSAEKPDASPGVLAFAAFMQEHFSNGASSTEARAGPAHAPAAERQRQAPPSTPREDPPQRSFQAKKTWPANGGEASWRQGGHPTDSETVQSGKRVLGGGKYADRTYAEVFENDRRYCQFTVEWGLSQTRASGWHWPFIAYVQHRLLTDGPQPPATFELAAQRRCLSGLSFVITGSPVEMQRHVLEELISFFGGRVLSAVSSKTSYLIVGEKSPWGQDPELGMKFSRAKQNDIPHRSVAQLLDDLRDSNDGGEQETFRYPAE